VRGENELWKHDKQGGQIQAFCFTSPA